MTEKEKAQELVEKFSVPINESDFHVPEFISGVPCADSSKEYTKVLKEETNMLAKECALICVDEIIDALDALPNNAYTAKIDKAADYYQDVKSEIKKL